MPITQPLWRPSPEQIGRANMTAFMRRVERESGMRLPDYPALYRWSIDEPEAFWRSLWSFADVVARRQGEVVLTNGQRMPGARWFPQARLNFAENLLRYRDDAPAIIFRGEHQVRRQFTRNELYDQVSRLAQALRAAGVGRGDRVAAFMPNMPETVIAMLAAAAIGALWSSCSPDFGVAGVLDRFGQIEPKVLFTADGYFYQGKALDSLAKAAEMCAHMPSLERAIVVPYREAQPAIPGALPRAQTLGEFIAGFAPAAIRFEQLPFDHPLYIMYSSGTTGVPKCIVHGAGGTLIQHLKEHLLHGDVKPGDRVFYFTTCGWMMWNWQVSALAAGATLLLYDGSPFYPDGNALFDFAEREAMTHFGTSAKFIDSVNKAGLAPIKSHRLDALKMMLSTGSPLAPESFDFVYRAIKADLCLASISGGTDIVSCFALGNPILPVWRGELQSRGLGMRVEVFDEDGHAVRGRQGELVCTAPFPCMPTGFWNDPDGAKYRAAYFEKYPGVWCHGDYVALTEHDGMIIYGRSDAVLNPGGVRLGTAEIYRQVEQLDEVVESIVIGQEWQGDVRVVLFVRLREGLALDDKLITRIRQPIRRNCSPRHVPAVVAQVTDIPRTRSGKLVELAVRDVVHGRAVKNLHALANPEALEQFRDRPELKV
ncbi:MAG: acetoacetate--CoA ligase [Gammaproteobacteria bacterium]